MSESSDTSEETSSSEGAKKRIPGVVVVLSRDTPMLLAIPLERGRAVVGRTLGDGTRLPDERVSREHVEIQHDGKGWTLRDLGSTNGTFVDGMRATGTVTVAAPQVVRIGNTLLLLREDIGPFRGVSVRVEDGVVIGPALAHCLGSVERAARTRSSLLLVGESGSGKEFAARRFHALGPSSKGPLVAVNCAAIPAGVAERLLFGARRGAFSGATENASGYLQSADGGVLFLDELGELSLEVQAKLLRVIETKEVLAVGALRPQQVDVRLCFATNRNLRTDVADGKFRADLYYRIQTPEVVLPPLRSRLEEVPWLVRHALSGLEPHAKLVETCMLRAWPGNVRELLSEVREAGGKAVEEGVSVVGADHLREHAGVALVGSASAPSAPARKSSTEPLTRDEITEALEANEQNLAAAARALNVHRTQLYRRMAELEMPTPGRKKSD